MGRITKACLIGSLTLLSLFIAYQKAPQLGLRAEVAAGRLAWHAVPVAAFTPGRFDGPTASIQLGAASLKIPRASLPRPDSQDWENYANDHILRVRIGQVILVAWAPAADALPCYRDLLDPRYNMDGVPPDIVGLIAAAYTADARHVSLLASRGEGCRLRQLLNVRQALRRDVESAEILRSDTIKGVLTTRICDDGDRILVFEYYSLDEALCGSAMLIVKPGGPQDVELARALVGSIRLPYAPDTFNQVRELAARD